GKACAMVRASTYDGGMSCVETKPPTLAQVGGKSGGGAITQTTSRRRRCHVAALVCVYPPRIRPSMPLVLREAGDELATRSHRAGAQGALAGRTPARPRQGRADLPGHARGQGRLLLCVVADNVHRA